MCSRRSIDAGGRGHLYINEMDRRERTARTIARATRREPLGHMMNPTIELTRGESDGREGARPGLPFGITHAHGWRSLEIIRHARRHRWDGVEVDMLNLIPREGKESMVEALDRIALEMKTLAGQANCHVICARICRRRGRAGQVIRPQPTLADIRGSGMIKNTADNVLFIWQDQIRDGLAEWRHDIYFAKARGGGLGGIEADFDGATMTIDEREPLM
jgi:hypothetical protein